MKNKAQLQLKVRMYWLYIFVAAPLELSHMLNVTRICSKFFSSNEVLRTAALPVAWREGRGANRSPGELNVKTLRRLGYISVFSSVFGFQ